MKRLILTTSDSGAGGLKQTGLADIVIQFGFQFVWGPLPSDAELAMPLTRDFIDHWLWKVYRKHFGEIDRNEIGLIDLCERCETIELWTDPDPDAQLVLIWLLDYLRPHEIVASKLTLVQAETRIGEKSPKQLARWKVPAVEITNDHFEIASLAWRAYRAPTPQAWSDLLGKDITSLPQLRRSVLELLEELPMPATGLGATEMRILELISKGNTGPFDVFPGHRKPNKRRVFGYDGVGSLLDGLRIVPNPPYLASTTGRLPRSCTPIAIVMRDTNRAGCRSLRSARLSWQGLKISAGTTRSTAGGVALN